MEVKTHFINNIKIGEIVSDVILITSVEDALDLMVNLYYEGFDGIIIAEKNVIPDFFDLKTKLAGEILQKFSTYRMRLAIVGDFSAHTSKSLKDFIFESNKNKHINFVNSTLQALNVFSNN